MKLDPDRPPFIFAGNLKGRNSSRMLTFGLAPHAKSEHVPQTLERYYTWRLDYFNTSKMPHRIHSYFARLCWGMLGLESPDSESDTRWLHEHGYLTFDLIPYYVRQWQAPNWSDSKVLKPVRQHFHECIGLVREDEVRFAVFSGKAWEELLTTDRLVAEHDARQLGRFSIESPSFCLSEVTGKHWHRCSVHVGKLYLNDRTIPAVVVGSLIHQIRGLSYDDASSIGRFIEQQFPTKFFLRIGAPIPLRRRFGLQTDTTRGEHPTDVEQSGAVYLTGDNVTA